jgi:hypothetical protein
MRGHKIVNRPLSGALNLTGSRLTLDTFIGEAL